MSTNRHQNPKIARGRRLLSPSPPISSTNNQAEDESHRRLVDSALNYTKYRDPASVIKEDEEESTHLPRQILIVVVIIIKLLE